MAEILLINPAKRKGRKMARKKTRSAAQRRATAKLVALNRRRSRPARRAPQRKARRRNPITTLTSRVVRRRPARRASNPLGRRGGRHRRRRNPIMGLGGVSARGIIGQVRDALIGAGGAVAVDAAYARLSPMLPATLQRMPGSVGAGDAVKALFTILAGKLLSRMTRGLSNRMAQGALTVQAHGIVSSMLPAGLLGYYSPARIVQGNNRVGPNRAGMSAYLRPGAKSPLLNAYMRPGVTPLLSGVTSMRERENQVR
jgi:hypothetical protein